MDPADIFRVGLSIGVPLISGVVVFLAFWPKEDGAAPPRWLVPAFLGPIFVLAFGSLFGVPRPLLPPGEAFGWLPWIALAASLLGLVSVAARGRAWIRWSLRAVMAVAAGYVSSRGLMHSPSAPWSAFESVLTLGAFAACVLIAFGTLGPSIPDRSGWEGVAILTLLVSGLGVMLLLVFSNAKQAMAVGVMAAALGGMAIAAIWRPRLSLGPGALHVPIMVSGTSLLQAYLLGDATRRDRAYLGLAAAAPILAGLGAAPAIRDIKGWKGLMIRLAIPYLPIAAALEWFAFDLTRDGGVEARDLPVLVGLPLAPLAAALVLAGVKAIWGGGLDPVD